VYKVVLSSGKAYIGLTTKTMCARLSSHKKDAGRGSKLLFHKALRVYQVLCAQELFVSDDEDILSSFEQAAIAQHCTRVPQGYNLTSGGEKSFAHHEETRAAISAMMIGTQRRLGSKHSDESKALMRQKKLGRKLSEETRRRMSESRKAFYAIAENRAALVEARRAQAAKRRISE
jgi:hypothetical protein